MDEFDSTWQEYIWIEAEVYEDEDGLSCYSGLAERAQVDSILGNGSPPVNFLRLDHVFWTRSVKESEWRSATREVVEYGKESYGNYQGTIYIRAERIILVSPLNGGADIARKHLHK